MSSRGRIYFISARQYSISRDNVQGGFVNLIGPIYNTSSICVHLTDHLRRHPRGPPGTADVRPSYILFYCPAGHDPPCNGRPTAVCLPGDPSESPENLWTKLCPLPVHARMGFHCTI